MKGLYVGKNSAVETVKKNSEELSLLAKGDRSEVMLQKIQPGKLFCIRPGTDCETLEFFYILCGSIRYDEEGESTLLTAGDYYYFHQLDETVYMRTVEETTLLYFSSQPVFHYLSDRIRELTSIVKAIEAKDFYTYQHNRRVRDYAVKIFNKLRLPKERLEVLNFAALFHDIGKVYVPDHILNKPSKLTDEEFQYIRRHPVDGARLVAGTILEGVSNIIEQHHERLDGSGYPNRLKGDETLQEAKIIAVVDSYDAMTTDRPYRKAMTHLEALTELKQLAGSQYDETVVKTFEEILKEEGML